MTRGMNRIAAFLVLTAITLSTGAGCIVRERRPATVVVHEDTHHHDHDHHDHDHDHDHH